MSGRQPKVPYEQAARCGSPFSGAVVDLPAVMRALHDFLAANAAKLARDEDEDLMHISVVDLDERREEDIW